MPGYDPFCGVLRFDPMKYCCFIKKTHATKKIHWANPENRKTLYSCQIHVQDTMITKNIEKHKKVT